MATNSGASLRPAQVFVRLLRVCSPLRVLTSPCHDLRVTPPARPPRLADTIRDELVATIDPAAADERLLVDLAANAASIAIQVNVATDRLAHVLPETLADPRRAVAVAKVLHELAVVGNTLVRRVESALSTAATLRVQRRVHRGAGG